MASGALFSQYAIANMTNNSSLQNITDNDGYLNCLYDSYAPYCDLYDMRPPFKLTTGKIVSAIAMAILIVVALVGNSLICIAFCHYKRLRVVQNYFIVSLAVSDLMVAVLSMPLWLSKEVSDWDDLPSWIDFYVLLKYWECIDILAAVSSIANLTMISLDRFFSIIAPLRHRTRMTPLLGIIVIGCAWAYSLTIALYYLADNHVIYTGVVSAFGFFLPLLVIICAYFGIYIKFRLRNSRQQSHQEGDWNLEKTLVIVIGVFVLCWMPFFIINLFFFYCHTCSFPEYMDHLIGFAKWMHYLNSSLNPIIYGVFNINFKTAFRALLGNCFHKMYSNIDIGLSSRDTSNAQPSSLFRHLKSIKRKLSMKRDVDESMVSNGAGELNDNSISMVMLALHLKKNQTAEESQEAHALLEAMDSRPSSKFSEELGQISDDQSSKHGSSCEEITLKNKQGFLLDGDLELNSVFKLEPREFVIWTHNSTNCFSSPIEINSMKNEPSNGRVVTGFQTDTTFTDIESPSPKLRNCGPKSKNDFISTQLNFQETGNLLDEHQLHENSKNIYDQIFLDKNSIAIDLGPKQLAIAYVRGHDFETLSHDSEPLSHVFNIDHEHQLDAKINSINKIFGSDGIIDSKESVV